VHESSSRPAVTRMATTANLPPLEQFFDHLCEGVLLFDRRAQVSFANTAALRRLPASSGGVRILARLPVAELLSSSSPHPDASPPAVEGGRGSEPRTNAPSGKRALVTSGPSPRQPDSKSHPDAIRAQLLKSERGLEKPSALPAGFQTEFQSFTSALPGFSWRTTSCTQPAILYLRRLENGSKLICLQVTEDGFACLFGGKGQNREAVLFQ
jgi:hypothetical protein